MTSVSRPIPHQRHDCEWDVFELAAAALAEDSAALDLCARQPKLLAEQADLWPALARRLAQHALPVPGAWRSALRSSTAAWLRHDATHKALTEALSGLVWLPIKGLHTANNVHQYREDRPMSDLDILMTYQNLPEVRDRLEKLSWKSLWGGVRSERYLEKEGYAWSAESPQGDLLEVHFRLWSLLPERTVDLILSDGAAAPLAEPAIDRAWAFILAAVHAWLGHRPRSLLDWWDAHLLATKDDDPMNQQAFIDQVTARAEDLGIGLPVLLTTQVIKRCWPTSESQNLLAERLFATLRGCERPLCAVLERRGPSAIRLGSIVGRRLLARRESRAGARTAFRKIWAHPGIVERQVEGGPFWWRRIRHFSGRAFRPSRISAASNRVSKSANPALEGQGTT